MKVGGITLSLFLSISPRGSCGSLQLVIILIRWHEKQAPASLRLVIILYYPQDATLEVLESKETACAGIGRSFALRRLSRVSLDEIRVGADVLVSISTRLFKKSCGIRF